MGLGKKNATDYNRGFYAGVDACLNLIPTIEEQGAEFRKVIFQQMMELRPDGLSKRE